MKYAQTTFLKLTFFKLTFLKGTFLCDPSFLHALVSQPVWAHSLGQCFPTCVPWHTSVPREQQRCAVAECRK